MNRAFFWWCYLLLASVVLLPSCEKKGCTDPCAYNYEPGAERDDGSCVLKKPEISFWSDGNSHGFIIIRIDSDQNGQIEIGEYFGTLAFGFPDTPFCGQYNTVTAQLGTGQYYYEASASDDTTTWSGTITLTDCECVLVHLKD